MDTNNLLPSLVEEKRTHVIKKRVWSFLNSPLFILKMKQYETVNILPKDKHTFMKLAAHYKTRQYKLFHALVKIAKQFKPELKDELK